MDIETLRNSLPGWTLAVGTLDGVMGLTDLDNRVIWLDINISHRQRRATLMHEIIHALRGDQVEDPITEAIVEAETARRLITIGALSLLARWTTHIEDVCDALDVDPELVATRLRHLTVEEASILRRQLIRYAPHLGSREPTIDPNGQCVIGRWWTKMTGEPLGTIVGDLGAISPTPPLQRHLAAVAAS